MHWGGRVCLRIHLQSNLFKEKVDETEMHFLRLPGRPSEKEEEEKDLSITGTLGWRTINCC